MPRQLSNSWKFDIEKGWKGVCVEANPEYHEWTSATRTCKLLRAAGGGEKETTAKFQFSGVLGGLSTVLAEKEVLDHIEEIRDREKADDGAAEA